jgi:hypothetical protein
LAAEIPGVLLVYATPSLLLALSYYFLFHLAHLARFAPQHKVAFQKFALNSLELEFRESDFCVHV